MPDPIFSNPRLAAVYDTFEGPRDDLAAYTRICEDLGVGAVADVGCGTGSLSILLANKGLTVTSVDPAAASLQVARGKDGAASVTWIHGTAGDLPAQSADVALMTGNVAQVFATDKSWQVNLTRIHRALRHPGYLVFETRRPERREWEDWALETASITLDISGIGEVEQRFEVTKIDPPLVSFRYIYRFVSDGVTLTSDSTLRFRTMSELEVSLTVAGFTIDDIREAPDRPGREYVVIAQRANS